jgi:glutamate--cysteine ligase
MLYSGIHFNFSFNNELIESAFESSGKSDFCSFKNDIYLELAQKSVQYAWLIVYLTAASPVIDCSFINADKIGETVVTYYSSARCSEAGYWNTFVPTLKYGSTEEYVQVFKNILTRAG